MAMLFIAAATLADGFDPFNYVMTIPIGFNALNNHVAFSNNPMTRVNIDFSCDSGSNWTRRIAAGVPVGNGEQVYNWSVRVTPDLWTERARVAVRSLWSSTAPGLTLWESDMSDADWSICGVRVLSPTNNATLRTPSYPTIVWREAGADYVDIGYSTNNGSSWVRLATVESRSPTNSYQLPFDGPTGRVSIAVVAFSNLYHSVDVNVIPW